MSKRITQTNEIQSGDDSGVVVSGEEKIRYSANFELAEFEDNDLITLSAAQALVDGETPVAANIAPWQSGETASLNDYRSHIIDGTEYLFRSTENGNTTEPTLPGDEPSAGIQAWTDEGELDYTLWNTSDTYLEDQWVFRDATGFGLGYRFYQSNVSGNINHDPLDEPEEGGTYWRLKGILVSPFEPGTPYKFRDMVFTFGTQAYISAIPNNVYDLMDLAPSWTKAAAISDVSIPAWNGGITYAKGAYIYRTFTFSGITYNRIWESKDDGNLDHDPLEGTETYWRYVGNNKNTWGPMVSYDLQDIVVSTDDDDITYVYYSNKNTNTDPLDAAPVVESKWSLIGAPEPDAPSLQAVTDGPENNKTTNALILTGNTNLDLDQAGLATYYEGGTGIIRRQNGSGEGATAQIQLSTEIELLAGSDPENLNSFKLRDETSSIAGAEFTTRVKIKPAEFDDEAATRGQLSATGPVVLSDYDAGDIDEDGNLVIRDVDVTKITGKKLLAAYVGDEPIPALYYRAANLLSGFGGYIGGTDLNIETTFI